MESYDNKFFLEFFHENLHNFPGSQNVAPAFENRVHYLR